MRFSYNEARLRVQAYVKEHLVLCIVLFFLFFSGLVAGINMVQMFGPKFNPAELPALLHIYGTPLVYCLLFALCVHGTIGAMLLLCGIWLPTAVLWPVAIMLRGILSGAYMGACLLAWPGIASVWLLVLLLLEVAALLPLLIRLSQIATEHMLARIRLLSGQSTFSPSLHATCGRFLKISLGFVPIILLESVITPFVLYMLGN
ncbi:hypothetical protein LJC42_05310 [Eubacteriales bacterium OttesenSCG-928-K08]|nr:hypothetical protein [Eubacteriales bacterium OttesenSCG-928-K08]